MQSKKLMKALLVILIFLTFLIPIKFQNNIITPKNIYSIEQIFTPNILSSNYEEYSKGNFSDFECSKYNLSVILSEETSTVAGNLTVDYYNDDPVNFTRLPFHLYPSGMEYATRPGFIEIINVTTLEVPKTELPFEVFSDQQFMWINLSGKLEPENRVNFCISFNTTLPDGGIDRANEHGTDENQTRIFKFASSYPMPCVYDELDGWNIDPYLHVGDPFYSDMAYYNLTIDVPEEMVVAATGELLEVNYYSNRKVLHFDPQYPVREVTFSASRYYNVESNLVNGVNVSTYFLPISYSLWHGWALSVTNAALTFYNFTIGIYPYNTFNVVEEHTHFGGMEYPLQVYITSTQYDPPKYALELGIIHETAHQWFYNMLGVDEVDWGFVDEGIVVWLTDYFRNIRHPDWDLFRPYRFLNSVRWYNFTGGLPSKINQSAYDALIINPYIYWYTAYVKTPTVLEHLRQTALPFDFLPGLRLFFQTHYFEFADLSDLKHAFETLLGDSLDWYFLPWFNNKYLPKYNFSNVIYDTTSDTLNITIVDLNEPLHEFTYLQEIRFMVFSTGRTPVYGNEVWINGTTLISIPLGIVPESVSLYFDQKVLVQFTSIVEDTLTTYDIEVIYSDEPAIPGFSVMILVSVIISLGTLLALNNHRLNKN
ncbi:MAG: M1 family metallopeptidase [Candidatus Odinarchaeota archaeon]